MAKLNTTGTALVYSTYHGGSAADWGVGIAVDSSGDACVTGISQSNNFPPTVNAFAPTSSGAGFATVLNPSGTGLLYSTYIPGEWGGNGTDRQGAILLDSSGNLYVTGAAGSSLITTAGAFQSASGGGDT